VSVALKQELNVLLAAGAVARIVLDDTAVEGDNRVGHVHIGLGVGELFRGSGKRRDKLALALDTYVPEGVDTCSNEGAGADRDEGCK
jgi:hypothetical protein